ncbi:MAG: rhodanese-like domain-containing protein [bacterium]|nr:rhodanese-like domain-containing protein [bacterium]
MPGATQELKLLDIREGDDFAGAHLQGSINIDLDGKFASWAGALLAHDRPIVLIGAPGSQQEATMRLGRIGYDNVVGYLADGMMALARSPHLVGRVQRITALSLHEQRQENVPICIVDVRSASEREGGHIADSIHVPLPQMLRHLDELPRDQKIVVHCAGGYRSAVAASLTCDAKLWR